MSETETTAMTIAEQEEAAFKLAQRRAMVYAESTLVPKQFQKNVGNVLVAQNMAQRMGADLLMVMQNLYIVHGNPSWSSKFLIACFNKCGRFSSIKYQFTGEKGKDSWGCIAQTVELSTGEPIEGPEVTIAMAKAEGWYGKNGSKWKTIPQLMLQYRAAAFLIRTTAPEIGMGLMTQEEAYDTGDSRTIEGEYKTTAQAALAALEGPKDEPGNVTIDHQSETDKFAEKILSSPNEEVVNDHLIKYCGMVIDWEIPEDSKVGFVNGMKEIAKQRIDEVTQAQA